MISKDCLAKCVAPLLAALPCLFVAADAWGVSVQTVSNPVANGAIVIDGNIADWAAVTPYFQDAVGDGSTGDARPLDIDILQGAVAHDDNNFYFLYRNAGDNMVDDASNWIFIDLDQNQTTGLNSIAALSSIGAEFNLGGLGGWNAWNPAGGFAGGALGRTVAAGDSSAIPAGNDFLEFAVSRTVIQPLGGTVNPTGNSFNLVFGAEDSVLDTSPNNGNVDWFTYQLSIPEPSGMAMTCVAACALATYRRMKSRR